MDTRKLRLVSALPTEDDAAEYTSLELFDENDYTKTSYEVAEVCDDEGAEEIARRWNVHHDLIRQLDGPLCQLEDSGTVANTDIAEARDLLVRIGFGDKALSALADHYENL